LGPLLCDPSLPYLPLLLVTSAYGYFLLKVGLRVPTAPALTGVRLIRPKEFISTYLRYGTYGRRG